ncbi:MULTISPECIES: GGDEF domain-containing protein [unclassified Legionella]|uniref:GGDEF domain-containing protein n=1 Tax=unclassified Legionella TaxID=2622702 RepID=UPI001E2DDAFF|nr:GGDEF domain-containing protein [Legionella sp. 31fI33]MCC5014379.1 GGDEF domain-containing protein [Legionella sp. 31fI33]
MDRLKPPSVKIDNYLLLLENSLHAIPFNILVAALLSFDLFYNQIPFSFILYWFIAVVITSVIRFAYCKKALKQKQYLSGPNHSLFIFLALTFLNGCVWGSSYLIFLPLLTGVHEGVLILVLGGMAAGGVASLSAFLPAYYVYILPMFLPVIIYNYSFLQTERSILATMFLLFVVMLLVIARINYHLVNSVFQLNTQKDFLINELSISNKKLEKSNKEIRTMSVTDALTGLFNRRYFDTALARELDRATRNSYPLILILLDIDNFKYLNDTFGHPYGDKFLCLVAGVLRNSLRRANDLIMRLGGDEFAIIAANMGMQQAKNLCHSIRNAFAKKNEHLNITLSMSIICIVPGHKPDLNRIFSAADKMLYKAKEHGKNQVVSQEI